MFLQKLNNVIGNDESRLSKLWTCIFTTHNLKVATTLVENRIMILKFHKASSRVRELLFSHLDWIKLLKGYKKSIKKIVSNNDWVENEYFKLSVPVQLELYENMINWKLITDQSNIYIGMVENKNIDLLSKLTRKKQRGRTKVSFSPLEIKVQPPDYLFGTKSISLASYALLFDPCFAPVFKTFIDKPSERGLTPLMIAADKGKLEIVRALLENRADPNLSLNTSNTPLMSAIKNNQVEMVRVLLEAKANVNEKFNASGLLPLHEACRKTEQNISPELREKKKDIVQLLLQSRADPNIFTSCKQQRTPIYYAARCGNHDIVKLLIEEKADIELRTKCKTEDGEEVHKTPLHAACKRGHLKVVEVLLKRLEENKHEKSQINVKKYIEAKTSYDNTALHFAAKKGHLEVAKLLLSSNAQIITQNNVGLFFVVFK